MQGSGLWAQLFLHAQIEASDIDDDALVQSAADRLLLVVRFDTEQESAAVDADQLAGRGDAHADGSGGEMAYVEMDTEALMPARQKMLDGSQRRCLDDVDHHRRGQHAHAPAADAGRGVLKADQQIRRALQSNSQVREVHLLFRNMLGSRIALI